MGASSYPIPVLPSSRTVIVTGGNTGIGYETAKAIARMGARVIIACRSEERAKEAIEQMKKEHNQIIEQRKSEGKEVEEREPRSSHQLLEYMHLDLSSLSSTAEFVAEFKQTGYQLHVLICNAGIAFANQGLTGDGFERHFQVNTEITRSFQDFSFMKNGFKVMNRLGMLETPEKGAMTTINCAVDPELAGISGVYYIHCKPAQPSQLARNEQHQDALWKFSIECLKDYVDENLLSDCGFLFNESEVKELFSSKQDDA